jgi:hypothetical protein
MERARRKASRLLVAKLFLSALCASAVEILSFFNSFVLKAL